MANAKIQKETSPNSYTVLNMKPIDKEEELSWKAKGLLVFFLGKPDDWGFNKQDIYNRSTDGKVAVESGLDELKDLGYLKIEKGNDDDSGKFQYTYYISDTPRYNADNTLSNPTSSNDAKSSPTNHGDGNEGVNQDIKDDSSEVTNKHNTSKHNTNKKNSNNKYMESVSEVKEFYKQRSSKDNPALVNHTDRILNTYNKHIRQRLKQGFSVNELKDAIRGLEQAYNDDKSWWSAKWSLKKLMKRGQGEYVEKFCKYYNGQENDTNLLDNNGNNNSGQKYDPNDPTEGGRLEYAN